MIAVAIAGVLIIAAIVIIYLVARTPQEYDARHAFADPADTADPDGARFIAELHHEELPAAGQLAMVPVIPADVTVRLPHAVGTWGKTVTQILDDMEAEYDRQVTR